MNPRLTTVRAISDKQLRLFFSNGEERVFAVQPYLQYPVYQPLADEHLFQQAVVFNGTVCWGTDGEIDFDPDTLYLESVPAMQAAA